MRFNLRWMRWGLLCLLAMGAVTLVRAQSPSEYSSQTTIRYHDGDEAQWAATSFVDASWHVLTGGRIPSPGPQADGFVWLRARLKVAQGAGRPFALRLANAHSGPAVLEIFVNGVRLTKTGEFPPHSKIMILPQNLVVDLPDGVVEDNGEAVVAIRGWMSPTQMFRATLPAPEISIDSARLQHALAGEEHAQTLLAYMPQFAIGLLLEVLGLGVLALGLWSGRRELLLCALWLVTMPIFLTLISMISLISGVSWRWFETIFVLVNALGMAVVVEFIWTVQGFRLRVYRRLSHACWILNNTASLVAIYAVHAGTATLASRIDDWLLLSFNVLTVSADLWAAVGYGRNRLIGAAMALISVGYFLERANVHVTIPWLNTSFFGAAFYVASVFIASLLINQTWKAWKQNNALQVEIAAARELQQQLVPVNLPEISGLKLSAVYLPAQEVGGDFYQVIPQKDGTTLVLVGDVSGKGLKAAMTGVLTIGAARAIALDAKTPAEMLTRLNREVAQGQSGGFVTCACVQIEHDGTMTIANAGHISPYVNGKELPVEAGLPLGIVSAVEYDDARYALREGDSLTLMSDGVVEAQNASGELFGFARTEAIASKKAEEIARAAMAFGQADDITVLTIEYLPVSVTV